jgi:4-amino-4-deoxy-L-arabinose transferase-like glycosyltransferase
MENWRHNRTAQLLAAIIGVGFGARLLYLGKRQPWTEELMQALIVRNDSLEGIINHLRGGMFLPAPLDYLLQKLFVLALGDAPWALRVHAVVCGSLAVWLFFRVATRLFGDRVALLSSLLFAFFPLLFQFSREGRPWSLLLLVSLLACDQLLGLVAGGSRATRPARDWAALAFGLTLVLYSSWHGLAVLVTLGVALAQLMRPAGAPAVAPGNDLDGESCPPEPAVISKSDVLRFALAAVVAVLLFAPWANFAWMRPSIAGLGELFHPRLILRLLRESGGGHYLVTAFIALGVGTGVRTMIRQQRLRTLRFLVAWAVVPLPVVLAIDAFAGYFFGIEQLLIAVPPLVLLIGFGLSHVGEQMTILDRLPYVVSSPALLYAFLLICGTGWREWRHSMDEPVDWLGTARFLKAEARPGDAMSMPVSSPLLEYHLPELGNYRVADLSAGPGMLTRADVSRRLVVCYRGMSPDRCAAFRAAALKDKAWRKLSRPGFEIFVREETP